MAGEWIKFEIDTPEKPEVIAMSARMGLDPDAVVGKLLRVWSWFDKHTTDGNAVGVTYAFLDRITGVTGFAEQMALVGWLEEKGSLLHLPNFDRHNGETAKKRALTNKRVKNHRDTKGDVKRESNAESNASSVTKAFPEKRREEKNIKPKAPNGAKGSRLPTDWVLPDSWGAWCRAERPDLDPSYVSQCFADYWRGKAGKDGAKADWEATWRNWVRRTDAPAKSTPRITVAAGGI